MIGFSRAILTGGRMAGPRMQNGTGRLIVYDINAVGSRSLNGTPSIRSLSGLTDSRSLYGTNQALRDFVNKRRQEKEKQKQKDKDKRDDWYLQEDAVVIGATEEICTGKTTEQIRGENAEISGKKVELGEGVPGSEGGGWYMEGHLLGESKGYAIVSAWAKSAPLKITSVNDRFSVKLPTHPLENGMIKHDHKVIQPATYRVTGFVARRDSKGFDNFLKTFLGAKDLSAYIALSSPWKDFPKMYLQNFTSRVNTQRYDVYEYTLDVTEILMATSKTDKTDQADLASASQHGAQAPQH